MSIPGQDAVTRFLENEQRFDDFLNLNGTYTDRFGNQVDTVQKLATNLTYFWSDDSSKGAGLIKYNAAASYPVGSIGYYLTSAGNFAAADVVVTNAFIAADNAVRSAFAAADTALTAAYTSADAIVAANAASANTVLAARVSAVEVGQSSSIVAYDTQANLYANLTPADKSVGYVMNDSTPSKNGTYRKSGASGSGSWIQSDYDRVALVESKASDLDLATPFVSGVSTTFRAVKKVSLLGANSSKYYYISFFFRDDVGTRFTFQVTQCDDASGTNPVDVCKFSSTGVTYSGLKEFSMTQISSSGVTGTLVIDFAGAASSWGIYSGSYATTGLRLTAVKTSAAEVAFNDARVAASLAALKIKGSNKPFADNLNNDFLRLLIKDIHLYGADTSHTYIISHLEIASYRCQFIIKDITSGVEVCQLAVTRTITDYTTLPRYWKAYQGALPTNSGMYCVIEFDWTQAVVGDYIYTTTENSGIHPDNVFSDEMISDYMSKDIWHEIIRVGASETFTTINAALASLQDEANVQLIQGCGRACYHHQILIDLVDNAYYPATNAYFPEFVSLRGRGRNKTFINKLDTTHYALLQMHRDTKLYDVTILSDTGDGGSWGGEYCVHSDDVNYVSALQKNRRLRQVVKRVDLLGGPNQHQWLWGCGISGGQTIRFEDVSAGHQDNTSTSVAFGFHNTSVGGAIPSKLPSIVEMLGCRSTDEKGGAVGVLSLGAGNRCTLSLLGNNNFSLVYQAVTGSIADKAADRYEWEIAGVFEGPISQSDSGMTVLQTTPGQTPSGSAAALIFGAMDELGRGELCIENGSSKSLGARLGDCSSVHKTLTIGSQTYTFSANHTAQSNSTIIALINAVITTHPVSEKCIQFEIFPDTGYTRKMVNLTGSTISAGKFVKRTGINTIDLATGTDDIYGFVYRDILNGWTGKVVTSKKIYKDYITGATADGKFGITAGLLDFGASTKVGYVASGIVYLY